MRSVRGDGVEGLQAAALSAALPSPRPACQLQRSNAVPGHPAWLSAWHPAPTPDCVCNPPARGRNAAATAGARNAISTHFIRSQTMNSTPSRRIDTDVLIVGAGPTGLTLAASLAVRGLKPLVIDRQPTGVNTSRAAVIHARTLEVLEPLGVAEPLVARGVQASRFTIRDRDRVLVPISFTRLPTRYPYTLMISQAVTEQVLLQRLQALGGTVMRPQSLAEFRQDADGVDALLADGTVVRARLLVGCDGMHSAVRESAGIGFEGGSYAESFLLADVRLSGDVAADEVVLYFSPRGMAVVAPLPEGLHRIVAPVDDAPERPDARFVQALLDERGPAASPVQVVGEPIWGSRFRVHHRIADRYRAGRVVLAGDAAHVHSPAGGQGMNMGMLDAVRLADAVQSALAGQLEALDAYASERRPVAEQVVALADRLTRLATVPPAMRGLRNVFLRMAAMLPSVRRTLAWRLSGLVYR
jgi:2-polyprenyl-6-methoxyphenol hydroxylase-like FAD-dependent oxidoreductase